LLGSFNLWHSLLPLPPLPPTQSSREFNKNAQTFILEKASWKGASFKTQMDHIQLIPEKFEVVPT
jgi:hypothetical protein